ncbi:DUF2235 domain-containing protein [Amycolatopsis acidiphila]|uniref:DUF2235 domain-containing protein n=1 Tax=Amycolatopsis acidiphila TaxID=715473 RepID=A0A558ADF7_9PSEU|nr:DUF2235 domain-containing protein [Amycolatopsis acidiphila]TVT22304.1 DUF2235 domain-containing protein [Amycolatopsis acidiphila]UIJ57981.1 DUF2235 domain-containing protein [Amycolatopsis acidiphila]GHG70727.1 hypothetical protein GCM10017788_32130 [Amycolatopsis acidiphila]
MRKRIIVCCDGTWNTPDQERNGEPAPTNVVRVAQAIADADGEGREQRVFYHPGLGTKKWEHVRGGAFGFGLSRDVRDTYSFVMRSYEPGDELFFFGFSRGAYTARSTIGLIHNSGLLRREYADKLGDAYSLYRSRSDRTKPHATEAKLFRRSYSYEPPIRFVGVWDTVGACGIPVTGLRLATLVNKRWLFHDAELSPQVQAAYQALAIDERRRPFEPAIWKPLPAATGQVVEQVWFTGVHSDVGGGYTDHGLSDLPLGWMVNRARSCGLVFGPGSFPEPAEPGEPHDSLTFLYRLLRPAARSIGTTDPGHEYAASSAVEKVKVPGPYHADNLATYLSGPHQEMPVP